MIILNTQVILYIIGDKNYITVFNSNLGLLSKNDASFLRLFSFFQKLGVPLEGKVRIQLNLKVTRAKDVYPVKDFRDFIFPVMWLEEVRF